MPVKMNDLMPSPVSGRLARKKEAELILHRIDQFKMQFQAPQQNRALFEAARSVPSVKRNPQLEPMPKIPRTNIVAATTSSAQTFNRSASTLPVSKMQQQVRLAHSNAPPRGDQFAAYRSKSSASVARVKDLPPRSGSVPVQELKSSVTDGSRSKSHGNSNSLKDYKSKVDEAKSIFDSWKNQPAPSAMQSVFDSPSPKKNKDATKGSPSPQQQPIDDDDTGAWPANRHALSFNDSDNSVQITAEIKELLEFLKHGSSDDRIQSCKEMYRMAREDDSVKLIVARLGVIKPLTQLLQNCTSSLTGDIPTIQQVTLGSMFMAPTSEFNPELCISACDLLRCLCRVELCAHAIMRAGCIPLCMQLIEGPDEAVRACATTVLLTFVNSSEANGGVDRRAIVLGSNAVDRCIKVLNRLSNGCNSRSDVNDVIELFRLLASLSVHPTTIKTICPPNNNPAFLQAIAACIKNCSKHAAACVAGFDLVYILSGTPKCRDMLLNHSTVLVSAVDALGSDDGRLKASAFALLSRIIVIDSHRQACANAGIVKHLNAALTSGPTHSCQLAAAKCMATILATSLMVYEFLGIKPVRALVALASKGREETGRQSAISCLALMLSYLNPFTPIAFDSMWHPPTISAAVLDTIRAKWNPSHEIDVIAKECVALGLIPIATANTTLPSELDKELHVLGLNIIKGLCYSPYGRQACCSSDNLKLSVFSLLSKGAISTRTAACDTLSVMLLDRVFAKTVDVVAVSRVLCRLLRGGDEACKASTVHCLWVFCSTSAVEVMCVLADDSAFLEAVINCIRQSSNSVKRDAFSILGATLHIAVNAQHEYPKCQEQMRVFQKVLSSSVLVDACCQNAVCDSNELNLAALGVLKNLIHIPAAKDIITQSSQLVTLGTNMREKPRPVAAMSAVILASLVSVKQARAAIASVFGLVKGCVALIQDPEVEVVFACAMLLQTLVALSAKRIQSLIVIDGWLLALLSVLKMPDAEGVDVPGSRGSILAEAQAACLGVLGIVSRKSAKWRSEMISQGIILICVQQLRSPCSMLQVNCCALLWRLATVSSAFEEFNKYNATRHLTWVMNNGGHKARENAMGAIQALEHTAENLNAIVKEEEEEEEDLADRAETLPLWEGEPMVQTVFARAAASDTGVLGAMGARGQTISMGEWIQFCETYDVYKNNPTTSAKTTLSKGDCIQLFVAANRGNGADDDRHEMSLEEFSMLLCRFCVKVGLLAERPKNVEDCDWTTIHGVQALLKLLGILQTKSTKKDKHESPDKPMMNLPVLPGPGAANGH